MEHKRLKKHVGRIAKVGCQVITTLIILQKALSDDKRK